MDQFSPFTIPQSPAINSMPPPSFAPPSLPPPLSATEHHDHRHHHNAAGGYSSGAGTSSSMDIKPSMASALLSAGNALSFSASMLTMPTPLTQGPGTPLNLGSSAADSHLQPTLQ
jgi:hypothetical protein